MSTLLSQVYTEARRITRTDSISLTDSALLNLTNLAYLEIQRKLALEGIQAFGTMSQLNLVAGQTSYKMPTNSLMIQRIEVNYKDANDETQWQKFTEIDITNLPAEWYRYIKSVPQSQPLMDIFANRLYIAPTSTESIPNGLRAWYIPKQDDFTTGSEIVPYPLDMRWEMLAWGISKRYWQPISPDDYAVTDKTFTDMLDTCVNELKRSVDEPIKAMNTTYTNYGNM